jgi:hypothetical protein
VWPARCRRHRRRGSSAHRLRTQPVVRTSHRGLIRGLLDRLDPDATLTRFVPHDPDRAGCEIDIDGLAPASN